MGADPTRFVIIGNGAAGTYAAEQLRKDDTACEIVMIDDEAYTLYNRVSLPRYLKGVLLEQRVYVRDQEWHDKNRIDLRLETKVVQVDFDGKTVTTEPGGELRYDRLLLATGGRPNPLRAEGADAAPYVFNFQYFDETKAMVKRIPESKVAVVLGGSFIGYELAEAFAHQKLETHWLMRGPWFLRRALDEAGGRIVTLLGEDAGVQFHYDEAIEKIAQTNGTVTVTGTKGFTANADLVGVGLGLTMNIDLFKDTALETNVGILTNERLETNIPDVWAAGDVAEFYDVVSERHHRMGTWDNALNHGRHVARNMLGAAAAYTEVPTYASGMFNSNISVMGVTTEEEPEAEALVEVDYDGRNYKRLFFLGDKLVGAMLIGKMKGRKKVLELISSRTPIDRREMVLEMLAMPEVPVRPAPTA
ncbi:MAG TPA: FAD-dependent oxidoreductase [Candidatus Saccharimonadales bacterium]|nr:FAD-dependent oxidoreductase [Candidatus Saccharimonadales bacterium]